MNVKLQQVRDVLADYSELDAETYASSTAYFSFVSLVPLIALCISLVSMMGLGEEEVITFFTSLVPGALDGVAAMLVRDAFERSGVAFSISTISLLWSASKGVKALRRGLNTAYAAREERSTLVVTAISVLAVAILGSLLAALMYLIFSKSAVRLLVNAIPSLGKLNLLGLLDPMITLLLAIPVIAACYAYLPAGRRRFVSQLPGAICAALACGALSVGLHVYMDFAGTTSALYGSLGAVVLFLCWMYFVSLILISCGFINRVLADVRESADLSA